MPGGARRPSRGELIRQRGQDQFVVRRAQLSQFAENLARDPHSEADPAEFLFHVRGVGGVGKSTLLRQWQEAARGVGAVTAMVDESEAHGVRQALAGLAEQLGEQAGPLKEFDKALEQLRRDEKVAAEPASAPPDGEASASSRVVTQAALGAASLVPGVGAVTAMANPDTAAQGLDRLRSGARARAQRRGRGSDEASLSRAFVAELERLSQRHRWVVLFFDTWEHTGPYLDGWLLSLLEEKFGPVPANVMVVLAGRDELAEREWAPLRAQVADVPLEVFTEAETRSLLASRGVTEPAVVEAVLQLSMGLPLLVALLVLARPTSAEEVDARGDVTDAAVRRFVQWITDADQRAAVRACALPLQLNEDVFAAAAGPAAEGLWEWLCGQPFVSGRGDFKQYHAVVRASMVRQQRAHSPQRWTEAHVRLADTHATWRTAAEEGLAEDERWGSSPWRRHRLDESYHRLCARPAVQLGVFLEEMVQAAGQDTSVLRQWVETLEQAAHDTADDSLLGWADRLRECVADDEPGLACLGVLLTHGELSTAARGWAHTYRGRRLYLIDHDEDALAEFDRALAIDAHNVLVLIYRGEARSWLDRVEEAATDFTAALELDPAQSRALAGRGEAYRRADRYEEAIADLTAALELDPAHHQALANRGQSHRQAGHEEEAIADLTAALELDPGRAWVLVERGQIHCRARRYDEAIADLTAAVEVDPNPHQAFTLAERSDAYLRAGRYEEAIADLTAALALSPDTAWILADRGHVLQRAGRYEESLADLTAAVELDRTYAWAVAQRGETYRLTGRYDEAVADCTAALELDATYGWAFTRRGEAHRQAGRFDEAVADFTAAFELGPTSAWVLAQRGETHRQVGRFDQAVADLSRALELDPTYAWAASHRGEAYRQTGRFDEAVADFTTAFDLDPASDWSLGQRGVSHRQAGRFAQAREDLDRALETDPEYLGYRLELLMLDTVESGLASCEERWRQLLTGLAETLDAESISVLTLFRALILGPDHEVTEATEAFLAAGPSFDLLTDLIGYLSELSPLPDTPAPRAHQCAQLINPHVVGGGRWREHR